MSIRPINANLLIEPVVEETAFSTAQAQYEERGVVIALPFKDPDYAQGILVGDTVYFDSWQAARFKNGEGKDIWLVHVDAIRAVEKNESPLSE